jgi:hypothetical protein
MRGDFTRDSFDRHHHYTRVLMQQGRVQLDADWNEQGAIAQHYARTLAADIVGPYGGPADACGFEMITDPSVVDSLTDEVGLPLPQARVEELKGRIGRGDFLIGLGRYYVDGLLCESDAPMTYSEQVGYPFDDDSSLKKLAGVNQVLVYLDVWERQVTGTESADILDVALGGIDTATRAQLVWQVKVLRGDGPPTCADHLTLSRPRLPLLRARATQPQEQLDACIIDPEARYRGAENQLYRVEIHRGGQARGVGEVSGGATFKWSRENGSVVFPVLQYAEDGSAGETVLELAGLGRDRRLGLDHGDWVELVDDELTLRGGTEALRAVERIDPNALTVTLRGLGAGDTGQRPELHPLVRRWDHDASDPDTSDEGALLVTETGDTEGGWIALEDGVMIQFPASVVDGSPHVYRSGDYWLVPARTATGNVIWPQTGVGGNRRPAARHPSGVEHHYAPLAVASLGANGSWTIESPDCRRLFTVLPSVT